MRVVATAGHVDHGKSTLVRALTGMEPDRWAEERRRGMTIDLGYAWMRPDDDPAGELIAFVDVPGHQRFIANMLAGLGPTPAVMFVVAADQGWQAQSREHLAAIDALGVRHGLLVVTRSDLADPSPTLAVAREQLAASSLGQVPAVAVSGATGQGLDDLRAALVALTAALPEPRPDERVRLWVDRAFTVRGAGTVVTGTLAAGTLQVGDELTLRGRRVHVRGLQSAGEDHERVTAVARVALNLRGTSLDEVARGDALLTPDAWVTPTSVDVQVDAAPDLPREAVLHVGTAAVAAQVRPLGSATARLRLRVALPLTPGDRAILRDPGSRALHGVTVLAVDPPPLTRRGAAARRAELLAGRDLDDPDAVIAERGAVPATDLARLGLDADAATAVPVAGWLVAPSRWQQWRDALPAAVAAHAIRDPLAAGLPAAAALRELGVPDLAVLAEVVRATGLVSVDGVIRGADARPSLGTAEASVRELERRLAAAPFRAPERPDLDQLRLGVRELTVAVRAGRLLRLPGDVLLLPDAPDRAVALLAALPQPFTTSQARQALDTTRRVAIPLLEHLDALGRTVPAGDGTRIVTPRGAGA